MTTVTQYTTSDEEDCSSLINSPRDAENTLEYSAVADPVVFGFGNSSEDQAIASGKDISVNESALSEADASDDEGSHEWAAADLTFDAADAEQAEDIGIRLLDRFRTSLSKTLFKHHFTFYTAMTNVPKYAVYLKAQKATILVPNLEASEKTRIAADQTYAEAFLDHHIIPGKVIKPEQIYKKTAEGSNGKVFFVFDGTKGPVPTVESGGIKATITNWKPGQKKGGEALDSVYLYQIDRPLFGSQTSNAEEGNPYGVVPRWKDEAGSFAKPASDIGCNTCGHKERKSLLHIIEDLPHLSKLAAAMKKVPGLREELDQPVMMTVFAPTNAAFDTISPNLLQHPDVLQHHMVMGRLTSEDLVSKVDSLMTFNKQFLCCSGDSVKSLKVANARIVEPDIPAENGVIHIIDTVILTPDDKEERVTPAKLAQHLSAGKHAAMQRKFIAPKDVGLSVTEELSVGLKAGERTITVMHIQRLRKEGKSVQSYISFAYGDPASNEDVFLAFKKLAREEYPEKNYSVVAYAVALEDSPGQPSQRAKVYVVAQDYKKNIKLPFTTDHRPVKAFPTLAGAEAFAEEFADRQNTENPSNEIFTFVTESALFTTNMTKIPRVIPSELPEIISEYAQTLESIPDRLKRVKMAEALGGGVIAKSIKANSIHKLAAVCGAMLATSGLSNASNVLRALAKTPVRPTLASGAEMTRNLDAMSSLSQRVGEKAVDSIAGALVSTNISAPLLDIAKTPATESLFDAAQGLCSAVAISISAGMLDSAVATYISSQWNAQACYVDMVQKKARVAEAQAPRDSTAAAEKISIPRRSAANRSVKTKSTSQNSAAKIAALFRASAAKHK